MTHIIERHLEDKQSEEFLKRRGFVLIPSASHSQWMGFTVRLWLDKYTIVRDDNTLYKIIYDEGYRDGKEEGKMEAVTAIQQVIYKAVYPQEIKQVENEPTFA